VSLSR